MLDFKAKMHQSQFRLGLRLEKLTALPIPSSRIKGGILLREGEGREGIVPQVTVALLRHCTYRVRHNKIIP